MFYPLDMDLISPSQADWGDILGMTSHPFIKTEIDFAGITIYNDITNLNGIAVHWHGIRRLNSNWEGGVAGVTQRRIMLRYKSI